MSLPNFPEYWLRGPLPGIPGLLQPVGHALLQAADEIEKALQGFPDKKLWERPAGIASVAFHLQHLPGVLDRLFTYAKGKQLDEQQLQYLAAEGREDPSLTVGALVKYFHSRVEDCITQLKTIDANTLTDARGVGRKQVPSTVIGLLFHAAEHTMRHTGQLLVTVRVLS